MKSNEDYRVCGPIDQFNEITQYFKCPIDHLSGISVRFGTYRKILSHRLEFRLDIIIENSDETGSALESAETIPFFRTEIVAAGISDTSYFHLYFPTLPNSKGKLLALKLTSPDAAPGEAVTAWLTTSNQRIPGHVHCRIKEFLGEDFGLQAQLINSNPTVLTLQPPGLLYSPLSSCNMNCTHCISRHSRKRSIRLADGIKQTITESVKADKLRWIFTDYSGDIFFADHKTPGELDFLLGLGIAIHIDTNGAYLDAARIEKVMTSKVDCLSISVDAVGDETYHRVRVGAPPIEQIFASAHAIVQARERYGRQGNFSIRLGFTMMRSNLHELPLFIQMAAKIGVDAVGCRHLEVYHADMVDESLFHHKAYFNSIRVACIELAKSLNIKLFISEALWDQHSTSGREPCQNPWTSMVLLASGEVMACCVPGAKMGNIHETSLEEIWQGETYKQLRARVNSTNPPSLCKTCPVRNSLNQHENDTALNAIRSARPLLEELVE